MKFIKLSNLGRMAQSIGSKHGELSSCVCDDKAHKAHVEPGEMCVCDFNGEERKKGTINIHGWEK
jgi:hypothetical protein